MQNGFVTHLTKIIQSQMPLNKYVAQLHNISTIVYQKDKQADI